MQLRAGLVDPSLTSRVKDESLNCSYEICILGDFFWQIDWPEF